MAVTKAESKFLKIACDIVDENGAAGLKSPYELALYWLQERLAGFPERSIAGGGFSDAEVEAKLSAYYRERFEQHLHLPPERAMRLTDAMLTACKEEPREAVALELFGDWDREPTDGSRRTRIFVLRREGVTPDDDRWWWSKHVLERGTAEKATKLALFMLNVLFMSQLKMSSEAAGQVASESLPVYGTSEIGHPDAPLPNELRGRIGSFLSRSNDQVREDKVLFGRKRSFNAYLRKKIADGEI